MTTGSLLVSALWIEGVKLRSSRPARTILVLLVVGVAALAGAFSLVASHGDPAAIAKLGPTAALPGWDGLLSGATQVTAAAAVLGLGVLVSEMVGREFTDGTVTNVFAVALGRGLVVAAKLAVFVAAAVLVAVALPAAVVGVGMLLGFGWPAAEQGAALARLAGLVVLSGLVALPCAWAASIGRGLLPGIGLAVGVLVATQVAVVAGAGVWFPTAAPALWALQQGEADARAFLGLLALSAVAGALTIRVWTRLQLDR